MNYLSGIDPHRLRFMDESGVRLPEAAHPSYGHAPIGERAIEIVRYHGRPNVILHLLAGLSGVDTVRLQTHRSMLNLSLNV